MKRLIPTSLTPHGGYSYTQPETNHTLTAYDFRSLVERVIQHRKANNLPVPFNIDDAVEMYICHERPELCEDRSQTPSQAQPLTLALAVRLTKTLIAAGNKRADEDEANRRAEICAACTDNVEPTGCSGCNKPLVKKAVEFIVGGRKTAYDSSLKSCKHCGCFNAAQVWIPLDALQSVISEGENDNLPDHCWKKI